MCNNRLNNNGFSSLPAEAAATTGKIIHSSSELTMYVKKITRHSGLVDASCVGRSVLGRPIWALAVGRGRRVVLVNASHHANEYITTTILTRYISEYARSVRAGGTFCGVNAREMFRAVRVVFVPLVNPDGVDLVTGALCEGAYYNEAAAIARSKPGIPFPAGWKANIRGVDLNLQYPARWGSAREIKGAAGYIAPSPRDWPGARPLSEPESRALYYLTKKINPALTLSFHTQGEVIYWKYLDMEPLGSRELAEKLARVSGYEMEETPYASGFAGYKDWFISEYDRPGCTIEAGLGESPLPEADFEKIYAPGKLLIAEAVSGLMNTEN